MKIAGNWESLYTLKYTSYNIDGISQCLKKSPLCKQLTSHVQMISAFTARQNMVLLCAHWAIM